MGAGGPELLASLYRKFKKPTVDKSKEQGSAGAEVAPICAAALGSTHASASEALASMPCAYDSDTIGPDRAKSCSKLLG